MARRNSAHGMHKTVRLLATGLAALILCGGMVLLFVQKERAAANAEGEPTAEPIAPTPAPRFTVVIDPGHGLPDKIALAGIKIVDRTASLGQLPEFRFRCQMIGSFVFGLFYSIILCPL